MLKESSSDESSDNENEKAPAASATVSNDKRTRVTANSVNSTEAFNGNSAVPFSLNCTIELIFVDCVQSAVNGNKSGIHGISQLSGKCEEIGRKSGKC